MGITPVRKGAYGGLPPWITPVRKGAYGGLPPWITPVRKGAYPRGLKIVDYFYQIKQIILQMVNGSVVIIVILKETICLD